jgi:large subunit ribosomal protein L13
VEEAVRGMLPKTKMGDAMYRKLKVYAGSDHPHAAQQPRKIEVA